MATANTILEETSTNNDKTSNEFHIVLGVTGSVAAIKVPEIVVQLLSDGNDDDVSKTKKKQITKKIFIRIVLTQGGKHFWDKSSTYNPIIWDRFQQLVQSDENQTTNNKKQIEIINYNDEWNDWNSIGDDVAHISIRNWADILVIVPLSAHTLAKIANGLCDDTLSCIVRAWPTCTSTSSSTMKPIILVPAMNTAMWEHPITQQQIQTIQSFYTKYTVIGLFTAAITGKPLMTTECSAVIIPPQSKMLACGDIGTGALAPVDSIVNTIQQYICK